MTYLSRQENIWWLYLVKNMGKKYCMKWTDILGKQKNWLSKNYIRQLIAKKETKQNKTNKNSQSKQTKQPPQ